jgi:hypothetical protein
MEGLYGKPETSSNISNHWEKQRAIRRKTIRITLEFASLLTKAELRGKARLIVIAVFFIGFVVCSALAKAQASLARTTSLIGSVFSVVWGIAFAVVTATLLVIAPSAIAPSDKIFLGVLIAAAIVYSLIGYKAFSLAP